MKSRRKWNLRRRRKMESRRPKKNGFAKGAEKWVLGGRRIGCSTSTYKAQLKYRLGIFSGNKCPQKRRYFLHCMHNPRPSIHKIILIFVSIEKNP